jgi:hypothetical protein
MGKQPLHANDFPVSAEEGKLITQDGRPIAETNSKPLAKDLADRLNEDEARKEEDRWAL